MFFITKVWQHTYAHAFYTLDIHIIMYTYKEAHFVQMTMNIVSWLQYHLFG